MSELEASLYELPFEWVKEKIKPVRAINRRKTLVEKWWKFGESRPALRKAIKNLTRVIATVIVAKHRLFVFIDARSIPSHSLSIITRDDYTTFGVLHSKFHEVWSLRQGTSLEDRPRYTSSTTFETFPFPEGLTPNIAPDKYTNSNANDISDAAARLYELRENWLNPPELVKCVPEVVNVFPDRIEPISSDAAKELKKRTLTNLYNSRPSWLDNAHKALDQAVADAYRWDINLSDEEILQHLLKLNQERAASQ
jgi:type II restriction/modification system DNA methylase subunit YeeA